MKTTNNSLNVYLHPPFKNNKQCKINFIIKFIKLYKNYSYTYDVNTLISRIIVKYTRKCTQIFRLIYK